MECEKTSANKTEIEPSMACIAEDRCMLKPLRHVWLVEGWKRVSNEQRRSTYGGLYGGEKKVADISRQGR